MMKLLDELPQKERPQDAVPSLALRPREAARALGVSERTLWTWTKNGEVPFVRRGKAILYPVDDLRKWLASQVRQATPAGN